MDNQIARADSIALDGRQSLAAQTERLARLRARFDFDFHAAPVNGRDVSLSAQCSCREVEQEIVDDILSVSDEGVVGLFLYVHLDISRHTVVSSGVTLARDIDDHTLGYACRNVDFDDLFAFDDAFPMAVAALVLDNGPLAAADMADSLGLHHAEDALLSADFHARPMTVRAGLATAAGLCSRAVAVVAGNILAHLELLGDTCRYLLQG